jgi:CRP/FNR family transcriptional regulator, cyclic AMP receptor protein
MISPEVLRRFPFFSGLDADQLKAIAMMADEVKYQAGEWIIEEDEPADTLYFILKGEVHIFINIDAAGETRTAMTVLTAGETIGWAALLSEIESRNASAETQTDTTVVAIDGEKLRQLLDNDHTLGYTVMQHTAETIYEHLRFTNYQLISLS